MQEIQIKHQIVRIPGFLCDDCYQSPSRGYAHLLGFMTRDHDEELTLCLGCAIKCTAKIQTNLTQLNQYLLSLQEKHGE